MTNELARILRLAGMRDARVVTENKISSVTQDILDDFGGDADAALDHAIMMANVGRDPEWNSVINELSTLVPDTEVDENLSPIHGEPENPDEDLYPDQRVQQHEYDWNDDDTSEVEAELDEDEDAVLEDLFSEDEVQEARPVPDAVMNDFEYDPDADSTEISFDTEEPLDEDFGSSDQSIMVKEIDADIESIYANTGDKLAAIEAAIDNAAEGFYDMMGYDSPDAAFDDVRQTWLRRSPEGQKWAAMFAPVDDDEYEDEYEDEYAERFAEEDMEESENAEYDYGHKRSEFRHAPDAYDYKGRPETSSTKLRVVNRYADNPLIYRNAQDVDVKEDSSIRGKRFFERMQDRTSVLESQFAAELAAFMGEDHGGAESHHPSREELAIAVKSWPGKILNITDETYGSDSMFYITTSSPKARTKLEDYLEIKGFTVNRDYWPGSAIVEVQVAYFKGNKWDE